MATRFKHWILALSTCAALAAALFAGAAEIYRWVDDQGRVHYGNSVPDAQKQKARPIDARIPEPSEAERREAEARVAREKAQLEALTQQRAKAAAAPAAQAPAAGTADKKKVCEEQWRRYRESQACFAPYRLATGGIKAEAFQKCTDMKEPAPC